MIAIRTKRDRRRIFDDTNEPHTHISRVTVNRIELMASQKLQITSTKLVKQPEFFAPIIISYILLSTAHAACSRPVQITHENTQNYLC